MASLQIKIRWPGGTQTAKCTELAWSDFLTLIESITGITSKYQKISIGFPPKEIFLPPATSIKGVISSGDVINVSKSDTPCQLFEVIEKPSAAPASDLIEIEPEDIIIIEEEDAEDVIDSKPKRPTAEDLEGFESQSDFGRIVRRVMPDDNSCLFHTIAYVLEGEIIAKPATLARLRATISAVVNADPITYDAATLGKSPAEYAKWIVQPNSWGGAIELSIFAKTYQSEIFALDVINGIGSCFGEDEGYGKRVYVIFDGIHYDAIALSPVESEPELDLLEFKPWDQPVEQLALEYLQTQKKAGNYTDTQNFQILCQQCQTVLKGEKGAAMHAMTTGHSQFVEKK